MSSHTPGPWGRNIPPASKYPTIYSGPTGKHKHVAHVLCSGLTADEIEGNANLIAAAPDLAEAAQLALALIRDTWIPDHGNEQVGRAWGALTGALTAAGLPPGDVL